MEKFGDDEWDRINDLYREAASRVLALVLEIARSLHDGETSDVDRRIGPSMPYVTILMGLSHCVGTIREFLINRGMDPDAIDRIVESAEGDGAERAGRAEDLVEKLNKQRRTGTVN